MSAHFCIRTFILHGTLGGARIGMTRPEIQALLGDPDQWGPGPGFREQAAIWRYGLFEVHFDADVAWLLFTDYLEPPDAGPGRTLDPWILDGTCSMTIADTLARLRSLGVHLDVVDLGTGIVARVEGGAELCFDPPSNDPEYPGDRWSAIKVSRYRRG